MQESQKIYSKEIGLSGRSWDQNAFIPFPTLTAMGLYVRIWTSNVTWKLLGTVQEMDGEPFVCCPTKQRVGWYI